MSDYVLAGDLGGTNLRVAAVDPAGRLLFRARSDTPRHTDGSKIVEATVKLANECIDKLGSPPNAFAFAIPAIMSPAERRIFTCPNLPELDGTPLAEDIEERLGIPVVLENDANAAAIGENWLGASRGSASSICLTLGTGVGGGMILDGVPRRGPDGTAGEIGHVCVEPLGPPCGCGSNGCLEQYASASALVRIARELRQEFPGSPTASMTVLEAEDVYKCGIEGDELCVAAFERMGRYLGLSIAGLINILNPEVIVIGGGASHGWDLFIAPLRDEVEKRAFRQPAQRAKIVRAFFLGDAGIVGAAYLALLESGAFSIPAGQATTIE